MSARMNACATKHPMLTDGLRDIVPTPRWFLPPGRLPDYMRDLRVRNIAVRAAGWPSVADELAALEVVDLPGLEAIILRNVAHLAAGRDVVKSLHTERANASVFRKISKRGLVFQ